jgi:hypothetical protein
VNFPEFCSEMKRHFGITNCINKFIDTAFTTKSNVSINIIALDAWLHKQIGDYENKYGISMGEAIQLYYGKSAYNFVMLNLI